MEDITHHFYDGTNIYKMPYSPSPPKIMKSLRDLHLSQMTLT